MFNFTYIDSFISGYLDHPLIKEHHDNLTLVSTIPVLTNNTDALVWGL